MLDYQLADGRKLIFRRLLPTDAAALLEFREQIPHESTNTMHYVGQILPTADETRERLAKTEADPKAFYVGVFDRASVVGCLNFRIESPDPPWVQHIGQFGVMIRKDYWGLGIGKHLLGLQEVHVRAHGVLRIEARVRVGNDRAIKLYKHAGFKIEGTRKHAAKIGDQLRDEHYIAKDHE